MAVTVPAARPPAQAPPLLASLTPEQAAAATADGRVVVIEAGAGTGKTHTLAARAAWLVRAGVPPHRIVALTFTRDATSNLRRRVALHLGTRDPGVRVLSFHQFAAREMGPGPHRFLEDREALRAMAAASRPVLGSPRGRALARTLGATGDEEALERLRSVVSYVKNRETTVDGAIREQYPALMPFAGELATVVDRYLEGISGRMDYDDLLLQFRDRLRDPAFRKGVQAGVDHLLVDEYQDVNGIQHEIVQLLTKGKGAAPRLTVVGDDRQAIYGFRGSEPGHLRDVRRLQGATSHPLTRNFRSGHRILDAANLLLPAEGRDLVPAEGNPSASRPEVRSFASPSAEAQHVADRVESLLADGEDPAEIAVLARARRLAVPFQEEVAARVGVEQRVARNAQALGDGAEWVVAWLTFLEPAYELSPETQAVLGRLLTPLLPRADGVVRFVDEALRFKSERARGGSPPRPGPPEAWAAFTALRGARTALADRFRGAYPLKEMLRAMEGLPWRDAAVRDAALVLGRHLARATPAPGDLAEARRALTRVRGDVGEVPLAEVQVTTIHAAKGLEWNHVFLLGAREGGLPSEQSLDSERLLEEEQRLLYVACTRPRRSLTVTYPAKDGKRSHEPCRYLAAWKDP